MKKVIINLVFVIFFTNVIFSQPLTGIKYVATTSPPADYATIALAVADLNAQGVGSGGVTFNIATDYIETLTARIDLTASGTISDPIVFQRYGTGDNPEIRSYTGTTISITEGIWSLNGSDYVTIDGIDLTDPNNTSLGIMEYGYGLFRPSVTDGAQNNTIKNCTITMNNSIFTPNGTYGILSRNYTAAGVLTIPVSESGTNSGNKFYSNIFVNCIIGIQLSGYNHNSAPYNLRDTGNDVGGDSYATGNYFENLGGAVSSSLAAIGVRAQSQWNLNISYNTITSNTTSLHTGPITGIFHNLSKGATATINYNIINLTSGSANQPLCGINEGTASDLYAGNSIDISNNSIVCNYPDINTGPIYGILNTSCPSYMNIRNNEIALTSAFIGEVNVVGKISDINSTNDNGISLNIINNNLSITLTGVTTSNDAICIYCSSSNSKPGVDSLNINNNTISGISYSGFSGSTYGIYNGLIANHHAFKGNIFENLNINTSGPIYMISDEKLLPDNGTLQVEDNEINGLTVTGVDTPVNIFGLFAAGIFVPSSSTIIEGNDFSNITTNTDNSSSFYGFYLSQNSTTAGRIEIFDNTISNITETGSGVTYGFYLYGIDGEDGSPNSFHNNLIYDLNGGTLASGVNVSNCDYLNVNNNEIHDLSQQQFGGYLDAIELSGDGIALNLYNNKIYDLEVVDSYSWVSAISISGITGNIYNNFISDLRAPNADSPTAIAALNLSESNASIFNNTIYLDARRSAGEFGTSGVSISGAVTGEIKNNIIINKSEHGGAGVTSVINNQSSNLNSLLLDHNVYYAGIPGDANLIYLGGTSSARISYSDIKDYIFYLGQDFSSVTEDPHFVNVTTTPYNLHLNPGIATECESTGEIAGVVTDDYDGDARQGSAGYSGTGTAPDPGADEFEGSPNDLTSPGISFVKLSDTYYDTPRSLIATIADASGVPQSGSGLPVLYWKKNSGTWTSVPGTWISGSIYDFTIGTGAGFGDTVSYYMLAQDNNLVPNVSCFPNEGAGGFTSSPPACSVLPDSIFSYIIIGNLSGIINIGGYGMTPCSECQFVDLTEAFNFINENYISGPTTLQITPYYSSNEEDAFPVTLNKITGSNDVNLLKIQVQSGNNMTISGDSPDGAVLKFNGTSNIIIDGSKNETSEKGLTISNSSATGKAAILLGSDGTDPSSNIIIKNCIIKNDYNSVDGIVLSDADIIGNQGHFSNIKINQNKIQKAFRGIAAFGGDSDIDFNKNNMSSTGADAIRNTGVFIEKADGITISKNIISNFDTTDNENDAGIFVGTDCKNIIISRNKISNLGYYGSGEFGGHGIEVATASSDVNIKIFNNDIFHLSGTGSDYQTSAVNNPIGICLRGNQSGIEVYNNSINLYGNSLNNPGALSQGIYLGTGSDATILNNLIVNKLGLKTSIGIGATGILAADAIPLFEELNNNNYNIVPAAPSLSYTGIISSTTSVTLSDWKTATGKETNSLDLDPQFFADDDLHFQNLALKHTGIPITGLSNDILGVRRSNPPDIGAHESLKVWKAATNDNWSDATNWRPVGVPTETDDLEISRIYWICHAYDTDLKCRNISIIDDASVVVETGSTLTINGDLTIEIEGLFFTRGTTTIRGNLEKIDE